MLELVVNASPIVVPILIYFVYLERTLTRLKTDVCWIKQRLGEL